MANGRRGRAQNNAAPSAVHVLSQKLNAQKTSMHGAKVVPSPVPRAFVQVPWNSWTYEDTVTTTADAGLTEVVDFSKLSQDIKSKTGIAAGSSLRIKVQSAQVWCTASSLIYPSLKADFYELNGNSANAASIRSTQSDKGTLNMPAKCGYVFPLGDSKDVLNSGDNNLSIVRGEAGAVGSVLTLRVQVLWQSRPASSAVSVTAQ